jgi:WD40 repeat protein
MRRYFWAACSAGVVFALAGLGAEGPEAGQPPQDRVRRPELSKGALVFADVVGRRAGRLPRLPRKIAAAPGGALHGHNGRLVYSVAFSPDGKTLASAGQDCRICLWDLATRKKVAALEGHEDWIISAAFSPDGKTLASADGKGTIRLWDLPTRKERAALRVPGGSFNSVAFSPDRKLLASGGMGPLVRLWGPGHG